MKKNNILYLIGGIVIFILIITVLIIQIQNRQRQVSLEQELQKVQEEKEFCDNLEINIKPFDITDSGRGIMSSGVSYALCSNTKTTVKSIITLINGRTVEDTTNLNEKTCVIRGIDYVSGYKSNGHVNCDDVRSIEIISERCPQVRKIIIDMDEVTCGI